MKNNNGLNKSLLQQFAVKNQSKRVVQGTKAVIYNRCSTSKQDSLEWQEKVCANFCKQNNWTVEKCFGEKESATTDNRKQFQDMLKFCDKECISHIVIFSYDRFSRTGDLSLLKALRKKGIKVHAATQSVDDQTASGRFSQSMYLMFAEMENEQRREKIIEGQKNKLRKGEWIGKPTIGYYKRYITGKKEHDHEKKQCFIDGKGKLLRQAFQWKDTEKISNVEVIKRLKTMGLTLTLPQLTRIFRNPFYCGYITSRFLDDGEIIRGKHEPLISEELFLRVNGVVNGKPHGWNVIRENEDMPLKASMKCSQCGRPLTAYPVKRKYIYYKCPNTGCCVNVSNKKLHELFEAELSKFTFNISLIPAIRSQLEATYWTLYKRDSSREKPMKDELARLKNELETMEFNLAIGKVNPDIYVKYSALHKEKIQGIEAELKILVQDSSNLSFFLDTALQNAHNLFKTWTLLDYNGKVRLQKLVYPDGLVYLPEIHAVRTPKVNPIFSAITAISKGLEHKVNLQKQPYDEKFHSVYSMFASSNFFWSILEDVNNHIIDFEISTTSSGKIPINYVSSSTAFTQTTIINQALNPDQSNSGIDNYDHYLLHGNTKSGTTVQYR